jgi:hypothetical protein
MFQFYSFISGACCPRNCSGAGVCTSLGACACDDGLIGEACRIQTCNPGKLEIQNSTVGQYNTGGNLGNRVLGNGATHREQKEEGKGRRQVLSVSDTKD